MATLEKVVAAAVQATPVFLDREATVEKAVALIKEAAARAPGLIVFPETFIPTYPDWVWRVPAVGRRRRASCTRGCWRTRSRSRAR